MKLERGGKIDRWYNWDMEFTGRKRIEYALTFREADRVPIELWIPDNVRQYPKAAGLVELVDEYCDCFRGPGVINDGLFGVPSDFISVDEGNDSRYSYTRNIHDTPMGRFTQLVQKDLLNVQYFHFKKHYFTDENDLVRFSQCDFPDLETDYDINDELERICGNRSMPTIAIAHPFGSLARNAPPDKFYAWLITHTDTVHEILEKMYRQINTYIKNHGVPAVYYFCALEMAIEPWLGRSMFDELIYQYDKVTNKLIHDAGGIVRHHAHGPVFTHLEHWADMGIDSLEPMELPPLGDTDLGKAKKLMGNRMSFGGNIPSQKFVTMEPAELEKLVASAIEDCAPGGGFILKGASSVCGLNSFKSLEQLDRIISMTELFVKLGLRYGRY